MSLKDDNPENLNHRIIYGECINKLKDWAPLVNNDFRESFNKWFRDEDGFGRCSWIFINYAKKLLPHAEDLGYMEDKTRSPNIVGAGLFCYVGQLLLYYCQYGDWNDPIKGISKDIITGSMVFDHVFNFVLMYLYVDYYLDDNNVDEENKKSMIKDMYKLIYDPDCIKCPDKMQGLLSSYKRILEVTPSCKDTMIKLFKIEVESVKIQKNHKLTRSAYMKTAFEKGGMTCVAIQSMFGSDDSQQCYMIGALLQLIDDMMDVYEDIEDGINTIATYDLKKYGNLDYIFLLSVNIVHSLSPVFTIFKIMLTQVLNYTVSMKNRFSRKLKRLISPFLLLKWNKGSHAMDICNKWVVGIVREMKLGTWEGGLPRDAILTNHKNHS